MRSFPVLLLIALCATIAGCGKQATEVSDPFYLDYIEDWRAVNLRRCTDGPGISCSAIEGLPSAGIDGSGPHAIAAGANRRFIVVAQAPIEGPDSPASFYYFARVPQEKFGWGSNPERVIGPLTEAQYAEARKKLGLPSLTIHP